MVSIHAFRGEGDAATTMTTTARTTFQSTPSGGKATLRDEQPIFFTQFQSTPSGGKATRVEARYYRELAVSIHAFRGEGDAR